jgi:RNA polymerase sigma-70 factor, ECF subfamily
MVLASGNLPRATRRRTLPPIGSAGDPVSNLEARFAAAAAPVYRELIRLCGGDRARAEDLRQDTFERAARHLERHPDREVGTGWFLTVARSAFIDQIRRERRDIRLGERLAAFARRDAVEPDWDRVSAGGALALLGQLNDEQRAALVLFHLHGLSIAEIAGQLDRSVRATESLLVRARHRLRNLVEATHGI